MEITIKKQEIINKYLNLLIIIFIPIYISCITIRPIYIGAQIIFILSFGLRYIYKKEKFNFLFYWSCIFFIIALLSVFLSPLNYDKFNSITPVIQVLLIMNLLTPYMIESEKNIDRIIYGFLLAGLVLVFRNFYASGIHFSSFMLIGPAIDYNKNAAAGILSFSTLFALYLSLKNGNKLYYLIALFFYILTIFTESRTAFGAVTIGIFYFCLSFYISSSKNLIIKKKRINRSIVFSILIIVIGIIAIFTITPLYNILGERILLFINSLFGKINNNSSTNVRIEMTKKGWELFKASPIIGWGINSTRHLNRFNTYLHNNYIEILASTGILGFISYYSLYVYCLKKNRNMSSLKTNIEIIFCRCLIITCIISDLGRVSYYSEYNTIILAFAFSLCTIKFGKNRLPLKIN